MSETTMPGLPPSSSDFNRCPRTDIWRVETTVRVGKKVVQKGEEFWLRAEIEPDGGYTKNVILANFAPASQLGCWDTKMERRGHGM